MSQSLLELLWQKYSGHVQIDVLANEWAEDVLSRMHQVNQVILNPFKHKELKLFARIKLGLKLRAIQYDEAIILPNSFKSAIIPFFANIKKRTGFVGEMRYGFINNIYKLDKIKLPLMIERFCALANNNQKTLSIPWPKLIIDKNNQANLIQKFNLKNRPLIALCPAAEYGPAKRWPVSYFAKLADLLTDRGYTIIILGSNKDLAISNAILNQAINQAEIIDMCGKTSLTDAIDILALAKVVVTNDSGLMHIACATETKVIAIYGSSSPDFTPPLSKKSHTERITLDCSPCYQRTCRFGHYNCLNLITPMAISANIETISAINT